MMGVMMVSGHSLDHDGQNDDYNDTQNPVIQLMYRDDEILLRVQPLYLHKELKGIVVDSLNQLTSRSRQESFKN
jgi:hypothetical protein